MKKNCLLLLLFCALFLTQTVYAKIWRVNNTGVVTADFTTAQAAHDGAIAGDTIHFEPSSTSYGNLTITKQLVLISLGEFLGVNPGVQYSAISGTLGTVTVSAAGSVLMINTGTLTISSGTSNVVLLRCKSSSINLSNADNTIIQNCFINTDLNILSGSSTVVVRNNIIGGRILMDNSSSSELSSNVITAITGTSAPLFYNSTIQNNILNKASAININSSNNTYLNNIAAQNILPAGNGNQNSVDMATVFVNPNGTVDNVFTLQTSVANPAQGAGVGGIDCGAFGGSFPFRLGLIPPIPSIYSVQVPATPIQTTMDVTVSTRSNN